MKLENLLVKLLGFLLLSYVALDLSWQLYVELWLHGFEIPLGLVVLSMLVIPVLSSTVKPGLAGMLVVVWIALIAVGRSPKIPTLLLLLAGAVLMYVPVRDVGFKTVRGKLLLIPTTIIIPIGLALVLSFGIYAITDKYELIVNTLFSKASGDISILYSQLKTTVFLGLTTLALALYVGYKALETIGALALLYAAKPPRIFEVEAKTDYRNWILQLLFMKGKQYGALREGAILVYGLLFSPFFFPLMRQAIASTGLLHGRIGIVIYLALGYVLGWAFSRVMYNILFYHPPIYALLERANYRKYLVLGAMLSLGIGVVYVFLGGSPEALFREVLTGNPAAPDPVAERLNLQDIENSAVLFIELFKKGSEAVVSFLWGG